VVVRLGYGFVTMEGPALGLVYLTPLQVGRLRGALRAAGLDLDLYGGHGLPARPTPAPAPDPDDVSIPAQTRRSIPLHPPARPTVADIASRLLAMAKQRDLDDQSTVDGTPAGTQENPCTR
jgi:hypothetical protein